MNNYLSAILAILSHIGVMTKEEAEKLDKELQQSAIPEGFESSWQMVKTVFEKAEVDMKMFVKK